MFRFIFNFIAGMGIGAIVFVPILFIMFVEDNPAMLFVFFGMIALGCLGGKKKNKKR